MRANCAAKVLNIFEMNKFLSLLCVLFNKKIKKVIIFLHISKKNSNFAADFGMRAYVRS